MRLKASSPLIDPDAKTEEYQLPDQDYDPTDTSSREKTGAEAEAIDPDAKPTEEKQPVFRLGLDLSLGKLVFALLLFGFMFALPVYISENTIELGLESAPYTQSAIQEREQQQQATEQAAEAGQNQEGRVAGVFTQDSSGLANTSIIGLPVTTLLIALGILLIMGSAVLAID